MPQATLVERALAYILRGLTLTIIFICLMDAINVDVIFAAVSGNMRYQDNPAITDSQFDTGSATQAYINIFAQAAPINHLPASKIAITYKFLGTTIYEDVDSPTVLDGGSTVSLIYCIRAYKGDAANSYAHVRPTLDRTISFLRILI